MNRVGIAQKWIVDENRLHQLRPWPARPGVTECNSDLSPTTVGFCGKKSAGVSFPALEVGKVCARTD
jgi:hypothetical protein